MTTERNEMRVLRSRVWLDTSAPPPSSLPRSAKMVQSIQSTHIPSTPTNTRPQTATSLSLKRSPEQTDGKQPHSQTAHLFHLRIGLIHATGPTTPQLVELKNGETFNGHLVNCDNFMNITLREVYQTNADGDKFWKLKECYIRGSTVRMYRDSSILPDVDLI